MDFKFVMLLFNSKVVKADNNDNITILFWNSFWVYPLFGMGEENSGFIKSKCKYTNCFTTHHRSELYLPDKRIDAVVVHGRSQELMKELKFGRERGMKHMVSTLFILRFDESIKKNYRSLLFNCIF